MNLQNIAQMSCNPAMGGIAKGQIVREIDALGGYSGIVSDKTAIQFKMLNKSSDLPSTLGGVPVFILPESKPSSTSSFVIPVDAFSPARPPPNCFSPIWINPLRGTGS